jgi:hypothetical protein
MCPPLFGFIMRYNLPMIKRLFSFVFFFILVFSFNFFTSPVFAQQDWGQRDPRCVGGPQGDVATIQGLECLFYNVLQVIVYIAGLAFLFMFISGGFTYLFSGGDQKKTAAASSTLTMAVLGLVGIIASWLILSFISQFTGIANITNYQIPDQKVLPP